MSLVRDGCGRVCGENAGYEVLTLSRAHPTTAAPEYRSNWNPRRPLATVLNSFACRRCLVPIIEDFDHKVNASTNQSQRRLKSKGSLTPSVLL